MYAVQLVAALQFEDLEEAQAFAKSLHDAKTLPHDGKEMNVAMVHVQNLGPRVGS